MLKTKLDAFEEVIKTHQQLYLTLVTSFGLQYNKHNLGLIHNFLTLDDLFAWV